MSFTSLLLLSMLLAAPLDRAAQPPQSPATIPVPLAAQSTSILPPPNSVLPEPPQTTKKPGEKTLQGDSGNICYKIHAFIFRRDDDHAPEFVRDTTCGPRQPHTKAALWPKAKLVPAN